MGEKVVDTLNKNNTMQLVLNPEGKYQQQIPFPKDFGFFSNLSVDMSITTDIRGTIYIVDENGAASLFSEKMALL